MSNEKFRTLKYSAKLRSKTYLKAKGYVPTRWTSGGYVDTSFIVPTSNLCEQFFSVAGYSLSDRRKGLSLVPRNFEMQMFLHVNDMLWSISDMNDFVISGKVIHNA